MKLDPTDPLHAEYLLQRREEKIKRKAQRGVAFTMPCTNGKLLKVCTKDRGKGNRNKGTYGRIPVGKYTEAHLHAIVHRSLLIGRVLSPDESLAMVFAVDLKD